MLRVLRRTTMLYVAVFNFKSDVSIVVLRSTVIHPLSDGDGECKDAFLPAIVPMRRSQLRTDEICKTYSTPTMSCREY